MNDPFESAFEGWLQSKQPEIENVGLLLSTQLSSEPQELINDLTAVEAWNSRVGELLAEANAYLDRSTRYYLPDRSGDKTEADRKAFVDDKCADARKVRDILENLSDCIKQRLILGESILRFEKPIHTPEMQGTGLSAADIMRHKQITQGR